MIDLGLVSALHVAQGIHRRALLLSLHHFFSFPFPFGGLPV
jgi:hypothetical protein